MAEYLMARAKSTVEQIDSVPLIFTAAIAHMRQGIRKPMVSVLLAFEATSCYNHRHAFDLRAAFHR